MKKPQHQKGEELWKQFLEGDKSAFSLLYKSYVSNLYQFGLRISQNQDLVKDALQELFVMLWNKKESLPIVNNVRSYLMTSLRNRVLRKISQSQKTSIFNIEEFLENSEVDFQNDENEKEYLIRELKRKIEQLPQRQKEVIHLRYYQNLNLTEIAEIMNMKYQSVSNLLSRAIGKMKNNWSEQQNYQSKNHN